MKKHYIKPEVEITAQLFEGHLCAGTENGQRMADWGAKGVNDYSNSAWDNEFWGNTQTPVIAGDDNATMNSTSNQYNLWEDED